MIERSQFSTFRDSEKILCPVCESKSIVTQMRQESFPYGSGKEEVTLSAVVPVHSCQDCQFQFTDEQADQAKHNAICKHLEVMTPSQITWIRQQHNLSRAEFARVARIGEASINRWENALLIQNPAMDQYLYLLSFPENFERVKERNDHSFLIASTDFDQDSNPFIFLEITEDLEQEAKAFVFG